MTITQTKGKFICRSPNRPAQNGPFKAPKWDHWQKRRGVLHCSFCGSLHPDVVEHTLKNGGKLEMSTKLYKAYLRDKDDEAPGGGSGKVYGWHFDLAQT